MTLGYTESYVYVFFIESYFLLGIHFIIFFFLHNDKDTYKLIDTVKFYSSFKVFDSKKKTEAIRFLRFIKS